MASITDNYAKLASAIIQSATSEYLNAVRSIMHDTRKAERYAGRYYNNRQFFYQHCNGLTGAGGEELLDSIDAYYRIDHRLCEEILASYGSREEDIIDDT